ncbi:hypothetical protein, variant [Cryptococcus amylolentus CBS 6039]|uniref:Prefoldin, alpha subunit n=1 Tax=Cryptococcus amylolentus CBS 6039 TaxID=1295533 RepID=A0A1E3HN44_9TREE|nr:hypothetical protein, variant [Cryptococcus amylolentus CBS 6039]ODN77769.1 hypothetical protein, variant [Cryptococcus amylolentus CBS 6039]
MTHQVQAYTSHLQHSLIPELEGTRRHLSAVDFDISEYDSLLGRIKLLEDEKSPSLDTMSELGAGVWVHTRIPDHDQLTLDLGVAGLHADMSLGEATAYIKSLLAILKKYIEAGPIFDDLAD